MGKTKPPTEPAPAAQPDEPYFEGQAAIAPDDVPSLPTAQQTSSGDGDAAVPPTSDDEASKRGPPSPDAIESPSPSSEETPTETPPRPTLYALHDARVVRARTADPTTVVVVSGEVIGGAPRDITLLTVRRRSRAHLDRLLRDERIVFEIVD